jgi:NADH dehydrogenase
MPEMMARAGAEEAAMGLPQDGPSPGGWPAAAPRVVVIGGGFAGLRAVRELRRAGVEVTLPGFPEVFAVGDMVRVCDGAGSTLPIPGVAPAAIQQGRHAARTLRRRLAGRPAKPFSYRDKGSLATIGRKAAVAQIHGARLSGLLAWLAWLLVHLYFLMGLQNRFIVFVRWTASFITRGRGARLITEAASSATTQAEQKRRRASPQPPDPSRRLK